MERYAFFRQLGKAVYGIDAAYGVFSKNAQIKPNMLWLLSALNDGEGHTQKQICWDWGFPKTTVNTLIKELEKCGFVVQSPIPGERRELSVTLTEAGRDYANEVLKPVYEAEERLFRLYFKDKDPEFVQELFRFSGVMHRYFTTGEFEETGSET